MGPGKLLALCVVSLFLLGFRDQGAPPDLSTPKAAVRSFVEALSRHDAATIKACIQGAEESPELSALLGTQFPFTFQVNDLLAEIDNDTAKVALVFNVEVPVQGAEGARRVNFTGVDMLSLQHKQGVWQIVPDAEILKSLQEMNNPPTVQIGMRPLMVMAAIAGIPSKDLAIMALKRNNNQCLSNTRQIALGVRMYVQDYDERFPRKKADYTELIFPYLRNREVLRCPTDDTGKVSYSMNANLLGVKDAAIMAPAQTVLIYKGKEGKLNFRHEGKAAVAFVDGRCKMIGPEEAKALYWYPAGKSPAPPGKPPVKPTGKPKKK